MSGMLYIIGTPIGNVQDITLRAVEALFSVEVLLCEDTRSTNKLLNLLQDQVTGDRLQVTRFKTNTELQTPKLVRFDENVERVMTPKVLSWLKEGKRIGLTTDAGMPGVSDPGMYLVGKCYETGLPVEVVPGVSALTTALAAAGFDAKMVTFVGFIPKKPGERVRELQRLHATSDRRQALVFYESPMRLRQLLEEIRDHWSDPIVAACGELTKMHEKVLRGKASEVLAKLGGGSRELGDGRLASTQAAVLIKGEWVVVVST